MSDAQVKDALKQLDPKVDTDWTADGLPRLERVRALTGDATLKRDDITRADPEFSRQKANQSGDGAQASNSGEAVPAPAPTSPPASSPTPSPESPSAGPSAPPSAEPSPAPTPSAPTPSAPAPTSEGEGSGSEGEAEGGEKKPNDMQGVYTQLPGLDSEGKETGVYAPDLYSVAGEPGSTAPEHIPQTATVEDIRPTSDGDQQAEGTDGTSVVLDGSYNAPPEGADDVSAETEQGEGPTTDEGAVRDAQGAVEQAQAKIDAANKELAEAQSRLDTAMIARENRRGKRDKTPNILRDYIDRENQRRSELGTERANIVRAGVPRLPDPRSPLDKAMGSRPRNSPQL